MSKKLIMGISDMADPSVSIIQNGKILFYIEEERLTRIKHSHNQFPINSIKLALKNLNIQISDLQAISYNWNFKKYENGFMKNFFQNMRKKYKVDQNTIDWQNKRVRTRNLKNFKKKIKDYLCKELGTEIAPNHVKRFKTLVESNQYDGVVFHRVIDGFMAQTGDVEFGNSTNDKYDLAKVGTGGSNMPNLKAEFSDIAHEKGILSMARSANPDSANSQFFICFADASHLDRNYTAFGKVIEGMKFVDNIKKGKDPNGSVSDPDQIISIRIAQ